VIIFTYKPRPPSHGQGSDKMANLGCNGLFLDGRTVERLDTCSESI
jgi:hypothetical protein